MTNRIMLRACDDENTVSTRTVSARIKSLQRFYIGCEEFDCLRKSGRIIAFDIHPFTKIRLDKKRDRIKF